LINDAQQGGLAAAALNACTVPLKKEAQVIFRRYGLNFAAQALQGIAMHARQQRALAPLCRAAAGEIAAHRIALLLQRRQRRGQF
jgi:hypothetical protein